MTLQEKVGNTQVLFSYLDGSHYFIKPGYSILLSKDRIILKTEDSDWEAEIAITGDSINAFKWTQMPKREQSCSYDNAKNLLSVKQGTYVCRFNTDAFKKLDIIAAMKEDWTFSEGEKGRQFMVNLTGLVDYTMSYKAEYSDVDWEIIPLTVDNEKALDGIYIEGSLKILIKIIYNSKTSKVELFWGEQKIHLTGS